jgi:hypothetical protein
MEVCSLDSLITNLQWGLGGAFICLVVIVLTAWFLD